MKILCSLFAALFASLALAATTNLPDPDWSINVQSASTTLIHTLRDAQGNFTGSKAYKGANQFYYFSECFKPDSARYRCNVQVTDHETLVALDGSTATVDALGVQFASTLITSGHNWWRQSQSVLAGAVTVP